MILKSAVGTFAMGGQLRNSNIMNIADYYSKKGGMGGDRRFR